MSELKFTSEVEEKLKHYVYRLIDPRNSETFYVGKGTGNRVFAHAKGNLSTDSENDKVARINEIKNAGFEVSHIIHRHGLETEEIAFQVEAALMDAYPGITNIQGGHGSLDYGVMHAKTIIQTYQAETANFEDQKVLLINISGTDRDLYEAVRYAWRLDVKRAMKAEVILAVTQGVIKGAFVAEQWLEATSENFSGRDAVEGRYGFIGVEAPKEIRDRYIHKRIPEEYRKKGASNPIKYTY